MIPLQLDTLAYQTLGNWSENNTRDPDLENLWSNTLKGMPVVKNPKPTYTNQKHPYNILIHLSKKAHFNTY